MYEILPEVIEDVVSKSESIVRSKDTVIDQLNEMARAKNVSFSMALYMLGFKDYNGF